VRRIPAALRQAITLGLLAAGLTATLVAFAFHRRREIIISAVLLALLIPSVSVGVAAATWDVKAFREPRLEGALAYAPGLINVFSARVASIDRLRDQAVIVARDVAAYYADERAFAPAGPLSNTYRVLHVTDLHLDPVGAELARQVARSYDASLVVDTGDLPKAGVPIETTVIEPLIDTSVKRVYIPGNHDSPASIAELRRLGVDVLTTGTVEVDGFRIFGVPDPVSRGFGVEPDRQLLMRAAEQESEQLRLAIESGEPTPTIIAMHNPAMERPFIGLSQLILSGHTHSARLYINRGTVRLNSGTLGGMPYDPQRTGRKAIPYSLSVLYFTNDLPRRLIAIDRISVSANRSTTVARDVIDESLLP